MLNEILRHFPKYGAPLTLVSDPDDLLAGEDLLAALYGRGYTLIEEADPIQLRHRLLQRDTPSYDHPLIVAGERPLHELPYDLWQQGERVNLSLPRFFPNLAYPVLQTLTPSQRSRLSRVAPPPRRLGERTSIDYILEHVFDVDVESLQEPAAFVTWLNVYHTGAGDPLSAPFVERLKQQLASLPQYSEWPLDALLTDHNSFRAFIDNQWQTYLARESGGRLGEPGPKYILPFEENKDLQDALPRLLRSGSLQRVDVSDPDRLPAWARAAVVGPGEDAAERRREELLELLGTQTDELEDAQWSQWQAVARTWAEFGNLVHADSGASRPGAAKEAASKEAYEQWQGRLDAAFLRWLQQRYAPLGAKKLPVPHHLFHVPEYLAWERGRHNDRPVALIILDGMALVDWLLIRERWAQRHPTWRYDERLLLAQIPSITSISRQALVGGERPADFPDRLSDTSREASKWTAYWARKNVSAAASLYARLNLKGGDQPAGLTSSRLQAACLVDNSIDDISHGTSLGAVDMLASLAIWLEELSPRLEDVIAGLLARGFLVYLASDHGHTEAAGMGNPREGQIAETRGLRARLYRDKALAEEVQADFPDTILWESDGLLPANAYVLIPRGRQAFTREHETVVTHGGLTLDEMVVPLIRIFKSA